ncbi:DNA-binding transcriptional regulator, LysR family [Methylobacterium phyllostachyos]|uniref:DNA-binding transcriptional regulator, LysR family n=1 Tax=Methylobacterium phyllostachyos TaxID=582672 RepID=A0A1G9YDL3_9HYPH|nr:LysR substrate-binding domain-containing protein [Methylobacterium phyllostachyos]SDN06493.1 DNA-binding transcriptional regulator, LysR family [Methylobacterium phyllostachyos]
MELRHLRYFLAVARHLNFTAAAESLGVAQPPLSQQIRDLEAEIGTALFVRTTRRVALTPAGLDFLAEAAAILERAGGAVERARAIGAGTAGILNVGLTGSMLAGPLARAIRDYARAYPDVDLRIHEMSPDRQIALLRSGQTDVSFLRCPPPDADLIRARAWREGVRLVLPKGHRLAASPVALADLAGERFVFLRLADSRFAKYLWDRCTEAGFVPTITHQAVEAASLTSLVAAGLGIAIIPECVARLAHADVVYRPLRGPRIRADVYALWMHAKQPLVETFVRRVQGEDPRP